MMGRVVICLFMAGMVGACAGGGSVSRGDRNVITSQELQGVRVATAFEAVQQLRPQFLRGRGRGSLSSVQPEHAVVYVDGVRNGSIEVLRSFRAGDLAEIRYLSASAATMRYGLDHDAGVIEVRTRS